MAQKLEWHENWIWRLSSWILLKIFNFFYNDEKEQLKKKKKDTGLFQCLENPQNTWIPEEKVSAHFLADFSCRNNID